MKVAASQSGSAEYVWVDTKLSYVIKWDMRDAAAEPQNIKEGPQSADLFEIPKSYDVTIPRRGRPGGRSTTVWSFDWT